MKHSNSHRPIVVIKHSQAIKFVTPPFSADVDNNPKDKQIWIIE